MVVNRGVLQEGNTAVIIQMSPNDPHPLRQLRFLHLDENLSVPLGFFKRTGRPSPFLLQPHRNLHASQFGYLQHPIPPESSQFVPISLETHWLQNLLKPPFLHSTSSFIQWHSVPNPGSWFVLSLNHLLIWCNRTESSGSSSTSSLA